MTTNLVTSSLLLLIPTPVLAGAAMQLAATPTPDPTSKLVEVTIGGLVVFAVTAPLVRWVLKRLDAQQKQNEKLIETLAAAVRVGQRDSAQHAKVQDSILDELKAMRIELAHLPDRVADRVRSNGKAGG